MAEPNGGLLIGVMGLTTVELVKLWQQAAPSLEEVRSAEPGDPMIITRMVDANYLGAGLALLIGGTSAYLLKSWLPLIMALGSVVLVSEWHRMVAKGDNWMMRDKS